MEGLTKVEWLKFFFWKGPPDLNLVAVENYDFLRVSGYRIEK